MSIEAANMYAVKFTIAVKKCAHSLMEMLKIVENANTAYRRLISNYFLTKFNKLVVAIVEKPVNPKIYFQFNGFFDGFRLVLP